MKDATVAGKTGTAQVIALDKERSFGKRDNLPTEYNDHAWFVALATTENPVLAIAVLVENGGHGGSAAAPIAGELIKAYLGGTQNAPPAGQSEDQILD